MWSSEVDSDRGARQVLRAGVCGLAAAQAGPERKAEFWKLFTTQFDGQSRACKKKIESLMETRRNYCEFWMAFKPQGS